MSRESTQKKKSKMLLLNIILKIWLFCTALDMIKGGKRSKKISASREYYSVIFSQTGRLT